MAGTHEERGRKRASREAATEEPRDDTTKPALAECTLAQDAEPAPAATEASGQESQPTQTKGAKTKGTKAAPKPRKRRFKVQTALTAVEYWQLKAQAGNECCDPCDLVRLWITPHLANYTYGPRPKWLRDLIDAEKEDGKAA
jgi:hypothetical protein